MKKLLLTTVVAGLAFSFTAKAVDLNMMGKNLKSQMAEQGAENENALKAEQEKAVKMAEAAKKKQDAMEKEVADLEAKVANVDSEEGMKKLAGELKDMTAKLGRTQRGNDHIGNNFAAQREDYLLPKTETYRREARRIMRTAIEGLGGLDGSLNLKGYLKDKKRSK
tara:strand:- start:1295 stop:1792 length:498 start_codon:yes stop_codon:yes gene_type:complete